MDSTDNDELLAYEAAVDPFFDIDCDPTVQTGSDWYALGLAASLGGKALHGFTFATTSETIAKTTYDYAAKHTVGWVRSNEPVVNTDHPGEEWDEVVRPTRLHLGVKTGSQLSLMFDTDSWEAASATRAKNTAFIAAGMVTHGVTVSRACDIATTISGEDVPEVAVMNTVVPVAHLKREAAGVAKASHAIFSRMNAQRYISWNDTQLHEGILPANASLDWAKVTVVGRYLAEANMRYDPNFRKLARVAGVPYTIVKGSWAYVANSDYVLMSDKWADVKRPVSSLINVGALENAYAAHTERLTSQIMRTYNELASESQSIDLEAILNMAEKMHTRAKRDKRTIAISTDTLMGTVTHQQSASAAANATATSATSYNALSQAFNELAMADRNLRQRASYIIAINRRIDEVKGQLQPFYPYLASKHTWIRTVEILDHLIGNTRTSLDRVNRLHRSVTQTSATIATDIPLTNRTRDAMAPHVIALIKRGLVRKGPEVALPRHITSFKAAVDRGGHARLLQQVGAHLADYKKMWADRYEDWARVFGSSKVSIAKSVMYGGASLAFRELTTSALLSPESGFIDGANIRTSYIYKMADAYARKRKLARPGVPLTPVASAHMYAEQLDAQYDAEVPFVDVVDFVEPRLRMFESDLRMEIEPRIPDDDGPSEEQVEEEVVEDSAYDELDELFGDTGDVWAVTADMVLSSYPHNVDADAAAVANGYADFYAAFEAIGEGARWDTESDYTRKALSAGQKEVITVEDDGLAIN